MQKLIEARDRVQESLLQFYVRVMRVLGVQVITTPAEYQDVFEALFRDASHIKIAASEINLFVAFLPRELTPQGISSRRDISEMFNFRQQAEGKGILITQPPMGSAPEIAEQWVDVTIPFSQNTTAPLVFITPWLKSMGMTSTDRKCYAVTFNDAIAALQKNNPQAAEAYNAYRPYGTSPHRHLFFNGDVCQVVELQAT